MRTWSLGAIRCLIYTEPMWKGRASSRQASRLAPLAAVAVVASPTHADADPIFTPLIISALASVSITGTAATITASIVSAVLVTAIGIGLTLLFAPKAPKPENGTVAVQQPIPYRVYGYGTARVPGATMHKEQRAGYLGVVNALNAHRVDGFEGLYLNDDQVTVQVTSDGFLAGAVTAGADGRYKNASIQLLTRKGFTPETAYQSIITRFPQTWGTAFRGDGCASLAMLCSPASSKDFATIYPYGEPKPSPIVRQALVFDPRDSSQDPSNPDTWKFSKNPALCLLHFRCFSDFGSKFPYATAIQPNLARWIQAANDCDDNVPTKAGSEPRYQLGGYNTTDSDGRTTEAAIRATMDAWTVDRGDGVIDIQVGKYLAPTVLLTDDDIRSVFFQRGVATKDKVNRATAKYTSPANGYVTVETDPLEDLEDQEKRFGAIRSSQMDVTWCQSTGQASRLLKREFIRQQSNLKGTLTLRLSGINACYARWVLIQSNSISRFANQVIEVRKPVIDVIKQTITIDFVGTGPEIDVYNPATDESEPPAATQRAASVGLPIPQNVSVVAEQINDASGVSSVYLDVSCDVPFDNGSPWLGLSYQCQFRLSSTASGEPGPWSQQTFSSPTIHYVTAGGVVVSGRVSFATGAVPVGTTLDVQVFTVGTSGTTSDASSLVTVSTVLASTAPGAPTALAATGNAGSAALVAHSPASATFHAIQFYRNVNGGGFATAQAIGQPVVGAVSSDVGYTDAVSAGSYEYFATALNQNGNASAPAGPAPATIT